MQVSLNPKQVLPRLKARPAPQGQATRSHPASAPGRREGTCRRAGRQRGDRRAPSRDAPARGRTEAAELQGRPGDAEHGRDAPGLAFVARLPEGRLPAWRDVFPGPSKTSFGVVEPKRLLRAIKEAARYTTWERRAVELRLRGYELTLVVYNFSDDPGEEASVVIDPAHLLGYLAAESRPFVLSFPPKEGTPLVCEGEGFRYAIMPLEQTERPNPRVPAPGPEDRPEATDTPQEPARQAPPEDETLSA